MKQTVILRKRVIPKVVDLPNGRSFTSRWKRISRKQLPINIKVQKNRTIGPRRNNRTIYVNQSRDALLKIRAKRKVEKRKAPQSGKDLASNLAKAGLGLASKALGSEFCRKLINKGIDNILNIFKFGASKIKNKSVKEALQSEIADMIVKETQNRAKNKYDSLF